MALALLNVPAYGEFDVPTKWHDYFCTGGELCAVGDFNGDHYDDVIAFVRASRPGVPQGDVRVALSYARYGGKFGPVRKWHDWIASNGEEVVIGDYNGDGRDDVAVFIKDTQPEPARGDVWVSLSTGINFSAPQKWHDFMCVGAQICAAGKLDHNTSDDIISFVRGRGEVLVALSTGNGFAPRKTWSEWFCHGQEVCATGDFNKDGLDDVIAFVRDTQTGTGRGDVWVAFSNGDGFSSYPQKWSDWMCIGQEICAVGNFDGFGFPWRTPDDAVAFVRDTQPEPGRGDVWVATGGTGFAPAAKWSNYMCVGQEVCAVGDFNGDHLDDVIAFNRHTKGGDVWVALSLPPEP
jgi:hypothetical protein